jgi:hypothetical protein
MGRIRTIKPEFFTSRSLSRVSIPARLTYAGLWTQADDCGRGVADVRILKGAIWPLEDDVQQADIQRHLQELVSTGHLYVYDVGGDLFFEVIGWVKHQASAYRRGEAKHPARTEGTLCTFLHDSARPVVQESAYREGTGRDHGDMIAEAVEAYVVSVCLASKNTRQNYRDAVKNNVVAERVPMLRVFLETNPDATVDDLRELLGLPRIDTPAPKVPEQHPSDCPVCAGEGIKEVAPNTYAPCDGNPSNVRELRPA